MMNQKFSQLNRDYAKKTASYHDPHITKSKRRVLGWLLVGFLGAFFFLSASSIVKKIVSNPKKPASMTSSFVEKQKTPSTKHPKIKPNLDVRSEYGFYTMLPNMKVKSVSHLEQTENDHG